MAEDPGLSLNQAVLRIGPKIGVVPDTLRGWIKRRGGKAHSVGGRMMRAVETYDKAPAKDYLLSVNNTVIHHRSCRTSARSASKSSSTSSTTRHC